MKKTVLILTIVAIVGGAFYFGTANQSAENKAKTVLDFTMTDIDGKTC